MSGLSYMKVGIALWLLSWLIMRLHSDTGFTVFIGSYVVMFWGMYKHLNGRGK